ncbi:MAG: hypothetical protein AAF970_17525 [Bacteroidota bacterium]
MLNMPGLGPVTLELTWESLRVAQDRYGIDLAPLAAGKARPPEVAWLAALEHHPDVTPAAFAEAFGSLTPSDRHRLEVQLVRQCAVLLEDLIYALKARQGGGEA